MNRIAMTVWAGCCIGGWAALSLPVAAAEPTTPPVAPPPPAMVDENTADKARSHPASINANADANPRSSAQANPIEGDPDLEPQVTLIERGDETHEEVRVNGVLRYIKVTSKVGTVYYLLPVNGVDGAYVRRDSLDTGLRVPMWQLFSW
ncbi:MAG: DUF2782 domain-containing protein [Proteobacteria bacterium]|nr:DUF2782 domain-containing protein [Pseudomonadota bacterium]MCL2308354.1 DUF2782 domain-containing protein [Pseudomonadota bacterium]